MTHATPVMIKLYTCVYVRLCRCKCALLPVCVSVCVCKALIFPGQTLWPVVILKQIHQLLKTNSK